MPERTGGSGLNERVVAGAGWFNGLCSEMPGPTSTRSILARLTVIRDGIEIAVDASQQVDQDFPLVLSQAGEQPALALEGCDDNWSWTCLPFGVSEIEWLRPSRGSVLIAINPRFCISASVRLTGPLSKPMT